MRLIGLAIGVTVIACLTLALMLSIVGAIDAPRHHTSDAGAETQTRSNVG